MSRLVQVAIPSPLFTLFDYQWTLDSAIIPGIRVAVPFGRRQLVGVLVGEISATEVPSNKIRKVQRVYDSKPIVSADMMSLLQWASRYYHHPLGEVLASALPVLLRKGAKAELQRIESYSVAFDSSAACVDTEPKAQEKSDKENDEEDIEPVDPVSVIASLKRAPLQQLLFQTLLDANGQSVTSGVLSTISPRWRTAIKPLMEKGYVTRHESADLPVNLATESGPSLIEEQQSAVDAISGSFGSFKAWLLNGVTGSGKTEVYLRCIEAMRDKGLQTLVLVPEISLTPQLMRRFQHRLSGCLVSLHSGLNDTERLQNWMCAYLGHADVVVGTRSAVLTPLPKLGLIIIDEEHDGSLKQQDGFRYHARDLALIRARNLDCPVVLGSATPSFESLNNVAHGRFTELALQHRTGNAVPPTVSLVDIRRRSLVEGMSDRLIDGIRDAVADEGQALVFINRRGFAPTLLCNDCGAAAQCQRCDAHMTVHARLSRLRCHHCGSERAMPEACESCSSANLDRVGYGTERIAGALAEVFPDVEIARIDRDSTRRKGSLQAQLDKATSGEARILVGTQMLAKGHHFPRLTLVGILDADRGLFGSDFRSLEHMAQLVVQVAGRAGRENRAGKVLIQTRNPDNPMLQTLVSEGYAKFSEIAMQDRQLAELPPFSFVALVRAEATDPNAPRAFLLEVASLLEGSSPEDLMILGPAPAPMERLGGRYRAQLLVQANRRSILNESLSRLTAGVAALPGIRKTRWSIDVDPVDLF